MRLGDERESGNVEDRRGSDGGGGGRGGLPIGIAGGGIGTVVLVLVALFFGVDPSVILSGGGSEPQQPGPVVQQQGAPADPAQDGNRRFVAQVLATTEDVWTDAFRRAGNTYSPPNLVLYSGGTQLACGFAQTATGPFYCPG